jgi:triacylglycerol esterase/lipase EstA (alpha/beta hydrolase family)
VSVPLESETTATLAYGLEGAPVWDFEIAGFRSGDFRLQSEDQLVMLHPFHPDRIPVVFVHGTASSPARWAEMVNELLGDAGLSRRYQFWLFIYNTGNPIAYSAMRLRESLQRAVNDVDPTGADPSLRQMVVIGHSQGGLLTKMTVVDNGTRFWDAISKVPFEQADLDPETRDLINRSLFVEPLPFVTEVIFIATPHRGSFLADSFLGTLGRKLVSLPGNLTKAGVSLVKLQPAGAVKTVTTLPTSIDNMKSSNPFLQTLAALPIAPGVEAHSIIAVRGDGPPEQGDDGVVAYSSAHLDGVDSELVVRSSHSTQATAETIEQVRRLLSRHLDGR